jgi:Icc protein
VAQPDPPPDFIAVNGDLARDIGTTGDYDQLLRLLARLTPAPRGAPPLQLTLGNHDHRERFLDRLQRKLPDAERPPAWRNKFRYGRPGPRGSQWVFLDSLRETDEIAGAIGDRQLQWLAEGLDQSPPRPTFVLAHHQPEDPVDPDDDGFGLADGEALLELLRPRPQVKALFHGHRHAWSVKQIDGLHVVGLPATSYPFVDGEPTGYVEARPREDHLELTRRCLDPADPAEGQVVRLAYR